MMGGVKTSSELYQLPTYSEHFSLATWRIDERKAHSLFWRIDWEALHQTATRFCYEHIQNRFISLEFFVPERLNVKLDRRGDVGYCFIEGIPLSHNSALQTYRIGDISVFMLFDYDFQ